MNSVALKLQAAEKTMVKISYLVLSVHLGSTTDEEFDDREVAPLTDWMQRTASALKIITGNHSLRISAECGICLKLNG